MDTLTLRGFDVYHAFVAGAKKLINIKSHLNKINVFPVPDGDTGSNMAFLMQTIIDEAKPTDDLSQTLDSIASAAMSGSRGNSGIIFAEYFNGLAENLKGKAFAKVSDFSDAVKHAIQKAYKAIMNPVEGTILTVLRKAFDHQDETDFNTYFKSSYYHAQIALQETPNELAVLKENGVVDAGAEGFTAFLEGINHYLEFGNDTFEIVGNTVEESFLDIHEMNVEERYCTEALLSEVKVSQSGIKSIFENDGSSLIVTGNETKMRIHIHTNHPDDFFLKIRSVAKVNSQKVDDMLRQKQAIEKHHPKIAIVTDSIADIPTNLRDDYQIHMIPVYLMVDDISYLDQVTVSTQTFYHMIDDATTFSSSQPDKNSIERMLDFLSEHYEQVLVITVASKLSGTYNAIYQYAQKNQKIYVFDSKQNSGGQGLVVLEASKLVKQGLKIDKIITKLEDYTSRTRIYVSVNTLKYMVKQGRVSKVTGIIAKLMNLKPVIALDEFGAGIIKKKALSLRGNVRQIVKLAKQGAIESYAMVHAMAKDRSDKLAIKIEKICGLKPVFTTEIGPVVAMNAGIGAIALAVTFKDSIG
jgi:hypothetical protein